MAGYFNGLRLKMNSAVYYSLRLLFYRCFSFLILFCRRLLVCSGKNNRPMFHIFRAKRPFPAAYYNSPAFILFSAESKTQERKREWPKIKMKQRRLKIGCITYISCFLVPQVISLLFFTASDFW